MERFLKDLCLGFLRFHSGEGEGVESRHLTPPVPILLTRHEASRLVSSQDIQRSFASWGIRFAELTQAEALDSSMIDDDSNGYAQVLVLSIPEVVADKVRTNVMAFLTFTIHSLLPFSAYNGK